MTSNRSNTPPATRHPESRPHSTTADQIAEMECVAK